MIMMVKHNRNPCEWSIPSWEPYKEDEFPKLDTIVVFFVVILAGFVALILVALIIGLITGQAPESVPLTCGVTEHNHSETYLYGCGKTSCIGYHHDLVCTNGTTILEWEY